MLRKLAIDGSATLIVKSWMEHGFCTAGVGLRIVRIVENSIARQLGTNSVQRRSPCSQMLDALLVRTSRAVQELSDR